MLSVISGLTSPGKGLRSSRCSRSLAAPVRSRLVGSTSWSSSSTPMLRDWELLKGCRGISIHLGCFARQHENAAQDDGTDQIDKQQQAADGGHGCVEGQAALGGKFEQQDAE